MIPTAFLRRGITTRIYAWTALSSITKKPTEAATASFEMSMGTPRILENLDYKEVTKMFCGINHSMALTRKSRRANIVAKKLATSTSSARVATAHWVPATLKM